MPGKGQEIYLEFQVHGAFVKVTAIVPGTGEEATITGPANAPRATLEAAVMQKLKYLRKKQNGGA
jgi:hypothetical protein